MSDAIDLWEIPDSNETYMFAGWRQWADAGSISSGLPRYLIKKLNARKIGQLRSEDFYLFQLPGTHDLVRPVVQFKKGYPENLSTPSNEFYYSGDDERSLVIFIGDEPHLKVESYTQSLLDCAIQLGVKRILGFGGVYAEVPYNKERLVSCVYSLQSLKDEIEALAVNLSDYHGGASIGSYVCKRAGEMGIEYISFYSFVPTYEFSGISEIGNSIRVEKDYVAWLNIMRRVNYMLNLDIDLLDLENKSARLLKVIDTKIRELEDAYPQLTIREYIDQLGEDFTELSFQPLDDLWEQEFRRLFEDGDQSE